MPLQIRLRLLAVMIVASALLGVVGWRQFAPRPMSPTTIMITPTVTTITGSQTIVTSQRPTEWIRVGEVEPLNYYLTLLESNGTQPYVQPVKELRRLPDLTNATAVAKITYLALNATNPEVKEAFELMIKGGTPDPKDFAYTVPSWNTELQVLYWLACQSEFKKDDTLALSIAIVHGLWVTMGDERVQEAVKKDTSDLLTYFRNINGLQRERGYPGLEDYPLEAKLSLAWTGGATPAWGEYGLSDWRWSKGYTTKRLDLKAYRWDAVNVTTLTRMLEIIERNSWSSGDVNRVVASLEHYFYFTNRRRYQDTWRSDHWIYSREKMYDVQIEIAGEKHRSFFLLTPNYQFDFYLRNGYVTGNCVDETTFIGAWAKSWGIATIASDSTCRDTGHMYSIYYDPATKTWKAYPEQLAWYVSEPGAVNMMMLRIFNPPIQQKAYLHVCEVLPNTFGGNMFTTFLGVHTLDSVRETFSKGLPTSEMKQWLLYS